MALRLWLGRAGTGKTTTIQREIIEKVKNDPLGPPIYVLVPDQISYAMEEALTVQSGLGSLVRVHVLSFKRLAWHVLQEVGGATREQIDPYGYLMLVRQVLLEVEEELTLFQRATKKYGFIEQMVAILQEMSRYRVKSDDLTQLKDALEEASAHQTIIQKVDEIARVAAEIEARLGTSYVDGEGHLHLLTDLMEQSTSIPEVEIYIDGFEKMTKSEFAVVEQLLIQAKSVTVALPNNPADSTDQLFYQANQLANMLRLSAEHQGVVIEEEKYFSTNYRASNDELRHLESEFQSFTPRAYEAPVESIQLVRAEDRRAEIDAVARSIRQLVEDGYRYKDVVIIYQQSDYYDELLTRTMREYDIPLFISQKRSMLDHPLIELTRAALDVIQRKWSYASVFRAVKTDLLFPLPEQAPGMLLDDWRHRADELENFVLAKGIQGSAWTADTEASARRWTYERYRGLSDIQKARTTEEEEKQEDLHEMRDMIRLPLMQLEARLKEEKTGKGFALALYEFMEMLRIPEKLALLQETEKQRGALEKAKEHEQAWRAWGHLLDQFVTVFGEEEQTLEEMIQIFDEGLVALEFSQIPPALDQVTVTTFAGGSFLNPKVAFLIGMNDGVIPARSEQEGLLTDRDREQFKAFDLEIAPSTEEQLLGDHYYAYRAFTAATERLYVSFALSDESSSSMQPSTYVTKLQELFPALRETPAQHTIAYLPDEEAVKYLVTPFTSLAHFIYQWKEKELDPTQWTSLWQAVAHYYATTEEWQSLYEEIIAPIEHRHEDYRLPQEVVQAMYDKQLKGSVSRIEKFHSCPFSHFASYGLRLRERSIYQLDPPAIGDLFHAVFERLEYRLRELQLEWHELTDAQITSMSMSIIDELAPHFVHQILLSSARYQYMKRRLTKIVIATARAVRQQAQKSRFSPVGVEVAFGVEDGLPGLVIPLEKHQGSINLRGRIDRVDVANVGEEDYVRIVDYKSSEQSLDLTKVYHGLSLQMLTYLDVVVEHAPKWLHKEVQPAGMFYMHVHEPLLTLEEEVTEQILEEKWLRDYRLGGYLLDDVTVAEAMDRDVTEGSSLVIPATLTKKGTFHQSHSRVLSTEDVNDLRTWTRKQHQRAGEAILDGVADVSPYELRNQMPCQYCEYKAVCQFDKGDPRVASRCLDTYRDKDVLQRIKREENEQHEHTEKTE